MAVRYFGQFSIYSRKLIMNNQKIPLYHQLLQALSFIGYAEFSISE